MKKLVVLLLLSVCVYVAFAAQTEHQFRTYNDAFSIGSRNVAYMDINFSLPEYEIVEENVGGAIYHRILLPDAGTLMESGMPELPTISINIAIPRRGGVSIEALASHQTNVSQFKAYPLQQGHELESPKAFVIKNSYYNSGGIYPEAAIEYSDPMIIRDFRIITVQINPFSYDAENQELVVRENISFRLNYHNSIGINELEGELTGYSPSFTKIYESMILNFNDYRNPMYANVPPRYLIIYGTTTDQNFHTALNGYILWKKQKGADVDVASTATNSAGSSTTSIKNYIQSAYNNPATRPDHVILIGDTGGAYTIPTFTVSGGPGDYPYTHLAGGDGQGDVFIGRISVEDFTQFNLMLAKTYLYERDINVSTAAWLERMLLVGDWSPSGISTMYISKYIKELALYVNPNYTFTELYGAEPSAASMNTAINQGVGFFSFRGYLGMSGWSPSESLNNAFRLLHAVIITCGTGNFSGGTATSEAFVRLGTSASPKGAVTAIGMATSSTHTTFNNCVHGAIFAGVYAHEMRTMGEALLHGKLYLNQIFGVSSPGNVISFAQWSNLMGDPTMEVFVGIPNQFNITAQSTIPLGLSLLDIAVRNVGNLAVEGACVTLTQGTNVIARGYTDINGNVIMNLPVSMVAGAMIITVSAHNFKPLQQNITVANIATLVPDSILIEDDANAPSNGNGDGLANGGETIEVLFGLNNTGSTTISGISGYITTTSPYVTFTDSTLSYPSIPGQGLGFNNTPIVMNIARNTPHLETLRIHLILTDSQGTEYDVSEFIIVHNAKIRYLSYAMVGNTNNALDPGETSAFNVLISNIGAMPVTGVFGRLYSLNDLVSTPDHTAYYGDLAVNAQANPTTDNFQLFARSETLPGMLIPMRLKLYNALGFEQWVEFTLTVGVVTVNDPLGPDTYGYVIFDDTDASYSQRPIYDWVGIAPAEGGVGTPLAISDSYTSGNEGDQVGANALAVVTLPFPFQFYGRLYSQITVCSNGFIALGVTANAEFRNFRLPGAMGPNPMIAAFWDDLATHAGSGIYTWFDRNNHAFVIEWYNMRNGNNGTSPETFQIILYDQSTHSTSLGDGPIKIQYHTFNNVDAQSGSRHGNFSTIGIEDHTGQVGLEYSFNNQYPAGASPLGNQRAIYITNVPVYLQVAHVILGETYITDSNGNSVCEPGETVELGIQLNNAGNTLADNIVATLSTDNQFVTIINGVSDYYPLNADDYGVNRSPYRFSVSPLCPNGQIINFSLQVVSGEYLWTRQFSIRIDASVLEYHSFLIEDSIAEFNGVIDLMETVKLVVNVRNNAAVEARNVVAVLSTSNPDVVISAPILIKPGIQANNIMQFVFNLQFNGVSGTGNYVPFQFNATSGNGLPLSTTIHVPYNIPELFSNFEQENAGFISETGWAWGTPSQVAPYSGQKVWATNLSGTYPHLVEYHLFTPSYTLQAASTLSFKHYYNVESGYDGCNVSISINNGNTWTILTPVGGYTHTALSGLNGEPGYSGNSNAWMSASFNLNSYAGQRIRLRFRFGSDGAVSNIGWFLDDFMLTGVDRKTGYLHGIVIPTSDFSPTLATVSANNYLATNPAADGTFKLYLPFGNFSVTASLPHHQSSSTNNVNISPSVPHRYTEFTLISLPKPASIHFTVNNLTGLMNLSWMEPFDPVLPVMAYKVYKKFDSGPFTLLQETTSTYFSETISLHGTYKYFVTVRYINTEGTPSDTVSFAFPYVSNAEEAQTPGLVTNLRGNYPNPFNPSTTISFDLAKAGKVKLNIYNIKGQLVKALANDVFGVGRHRIIWDGKDNHKRSVASGVYFYRLETKGYTNTRKMLMLK
ncbi:MAG: C25 family cysteine peptidase [Candidatus Cloacimonadaceae bacterium]|nr:C25 family cysteine peptidase [Candidatus Cloacimonadaceae bacterium]